MEQLLYIKCLPNFCSRNTGVQMVQLKYMQNVTSSLVYDEERCLVSPVWLSYETGCIQKKVRVSWWSWAVYLLVVFLIEIVCYPFLHVFTHCWQFDDRRNLTSSNLTLQPQSCCHWWLISSQWEQLLYVYVPQNPQGLLISSSSTVSHCIYANTPKLSLFMFSIFRSRLDWDYSTSRH